MNPGTHPRSTCGLRLFAATAALLFVGCASPGPSAKTTQNATATAGPGYAWHDPRFYDPWLDPEAVVLPPPPFTGFGSDGKIPPMLPTRPRPAAGP